MDLDIASPTLKLVPRQPVRLWVGAGHHLTGIRGTTWVTIDGEPRDILLEAGDTHRFARAGRVMVQALGGKAQLIAQDGVGAHAAHGVLARLARSAADAWRAVRSA